MNTNVEPLLHTVAELQASVEAKLDAMAPSSASPVARRAVSAMMARANEELAEHRQHVLEWQKRAERAERVAALACKELERWLTLAPCLGEKQLVQLASSCDAPQ
eukprot:COSAG01_NODE_2005_length_8668_cov_6.555257_2_plen_105_part_00